MSNRFVIRALIVATSFIALIVGGCSKSPEAARSEPKKIAVVVSTVKRSFDSTSRMKRLASTTASLIETGISSAWKITVVLEFCRCRAVVHSLRVRASSSTFCEPGVSHLDSWSRGCISMTVEGLWLVVTPSNSSRRILQVLFSNSQTGG